jgi:hypothetical protein
VVTGGRVLDPERALDAIRDGASIILPVYETSTAVAICAEFGLPLERIRQRSFGGEVYTQDVDVSGQHDPGASCAGCCP